MRRRPAQFESSSCDRGGRYAEGIGWAIGLDRLLLAIEASG
jgi:histidyl-tRNA synthetase